MNQKGFKNFSIMYYFQKYFWSKVESPRFQQLSLLHITFLDVQLLTNLLVQLPLLWPEVPLTSNLLPWLTKNVHKLEFQAQFFLALLLDWLNVEFWKFSNINVWIISFGQGFEYWNWCRISKDSCCCAFQFCCELHFGAPSRYRKGWMI